MFGCLAGLLGAPRGGVGLPSLRVRAHVLPGVLEGLRHQQGQRCTGEPSITLLLIITAWPVPVIFLLFGRARASFDRTALKAVHSATVVLLL